MNLSDEIVDEAHLGSTNQTELEYRLAWARTYLKKYGAIENSSRSVCFIPEKVSPSIPFTDLCLNESLLG